MLPMILFYCLKRIKIASKKGTWKWQIFISLRLKKSVLGSSIIYYLVTVSFCCLLGFTLIEVHLPNVPPEKNLTVMMLSDFVSSIQLSQFSK